MCLTESGYLVNASILAGPHIVGGFCAVEFDNVTDIALLEILGSLSSTVDFEFRCIQTRTDFSDMVQNWANRANRAQRVHHDESSKGIIREMSGPSSPRLKVGTFGPKIC